MAIRDGEWYRTIEECRAAAGRIRTNVDRAVFLRNAAFSGAGREYLRSEEWNRCAWSQPEP